MTAWDEVPWSGTGMPANLDNDHVRSQAADVLELLGRWGSTGALVLARSYRGPVALAATALTVLSIEPPTVSFEVKAADPAWAAMAVASHVGLHALDDADRTRGSAGCEMPAGWWPGPCGVPLLDRPEGWLVAQVQQRIGVGDRVGVVAVVQYSGVCAAAARRLAHRKGGAHVQLGDLRLLRGGRRGWLWGARAAGARRISGQSPLSL